MRTNLGVEILGLVSGPFANLFRATAEGFGSVRIALSGTELEKVKRGIEFLEAERNSGLPFVLEAGKSPFNPGGHVGVLGPEGIDARLKELRARQTQLEAALQVQEVVTTARRFPVPPGAPSGKGVGKSRATSGALGGSAVGLDSADNLANITLQFEGYSRAQQEFREQNLQDLQRYSDDLLAINLATEEQRVADTIDVEERIYDLKAGAIDAAGDLLSLLAVKSRTAAIALIAINKAAAISQIIQATALAAAKGIAIFGPTPAGFAAAAAAKAFGALQIGLVAATGALQIGSLSGDSGRGGASGGARSVTPGDDDRPVAAGASPLTATNIYISGYIGEAQVRQMVEALERKFAQDVVIISANSRQAIELRRD